MHECTRARASGAPTLRPTPDQKAGREKKKIHGFRSTHKNNRAPDGVDCRPAASASEQQRQQGSKQRQGADGSNSASRASSAARAASKQHAAAGNKQQAAQREQQASKQPQQANSKQAAQREQAALGVVGGTEVSVARAKVIIPPKKTVGAVTPTARVQAMLTAVKSKAGGRR